MYPTLRTRVKLLMKTVAVILLLETKDPNFKSTQHEPTATFARTKMYSNLAFNKYVFLGHLSSLWSIWLIFSEFVGVATWHSCEIKFLIEESLCSDTLPR